MTIVHVSGCKAIVGLLHFMNDRMCVLNSVECMKVNSSTKSLLGMFLECGFHLIYYGCINLGYWLHSGSIVFITGANSLNLCQEGDCQF